MPDLGKLLRKAEKMVVNQRLNKAVALYDEILQINPGDVSILNILGDILVRLKRTTEAAKCFQEAGSAYTTQRKFSSALAMYKRVHSLAPSLDTTLKLIELSTKVNNHGELARLLQSFPEQLGASDSSKDQVRSKIKRAIKISEEALEKLPDHIGLLSALADLQRFGSNLEEASRYDLRLGKALQAAGRPDESLQVLYPLLNLGDPPISILEFIAKAHLQKREPEKALEILSKATAQDPSNIDLIRIQAQVLIGCEDYTKAIEAHHKLLLRDPAAVKEVIHLAEHLVEIDHPDEAASALELLTREMTIDNRTRIMSICKRALSKNLNHIPCLEKIAFLQKEMNQMLQLNATYFSLFKLYMEKGDKVKAFRMGQNLQETGYAGESFKERFSKLAEELRDNDLVGPLLKQRSKVSLDAGTPLRAIKSMQPRSSELPEAISSVGRSERTSEEDTEGAVLNADLLVKYGAREKALAYLKEQLHRSPTSIAISEKLKEYYLNDQNLPAAAKQCLHLSNLFHRAGKLEIARKLFEEAQVYNPEIKKVISKKVTSKKVSPRTPPPKPRPARVRDLGNLQPGDELSHYKVLSKLGGGGMGVVYRAEDLQLQRHVAIKVLSPDIMETERNRDRFLLEARSASRLNHPNICIIYGIELVEDTSMIIMEYIEGRSLLEIVTTGPISAQKVLNYGVQMADALEEAHGKNIIHRDIKSSNILVTDKHDSIKVLDFGLAKQVTQTMTDGAGRSGESSPNVTQEGTIVGTVTYMSPEQALGESLDPRSDIFSLGVVLYEISTGILPFEGQHYFEILYSIVNSDPTPAREVNPSISPELNRIILKAMEKNPRDRYFSARQMGDDLKKLQL